MMQFQLVKGAKISPDDLPKFEDDCDIVAGEKKDGFREVLIFESDCTKLLQASFADHSLYVPHITNVVVPTLMGTMLDCEGLGPDGTIKTAKSVFSGGFLRSVEWQKAHGRGRLLVFDILKYKGNEVTALPFRDRRVLLEHIYREIKNLTQIEEISLEVLRSDVSNYFREVEARKGEGIVLKRLSCGYYDKRAWYKVKRFDNWDVIVTGFKPGKGSRLLRNSELTFDQVIGAVEYGWYKNGKIVSVGHSSGMNDEDRIMLTQNRESLIGTVIELKGQEISKDGAIRFPKFVRLRPDKAAEECIWEAPV